MCQKHGLEFIQFKCDLCCNMATYHGNGNQYQCAECYFKPDRMIKRNCGGNRTKCPLDTEHAVGHRGIAVFGCYVCASQEDAHRVRRPLHQPMDRARSAYEKGKREVNEMAQRIVREKSRSLKRSNSGKRVRCLMAAAEGDEKAWLKYEELAGRSPRDRTRGAI